MTANSLFDLSAYETYLQDDFKKFSTGLVTPQQNRLAEAMRYSIFSGGKRLRPVFCFAWAEALGLQDQKVWAWATIIEWLHTYSLIHDDLPAMDNDDLRRGQPTNHKVFGEDFALLAGDGLLTEAFGKIISTYGNQDRLALRLVRLLSLTAGCEGMVGGQAIDLRLPEKVTQDTIYHLHKLKTGALFRACAEGVYWIAQEQNQSVAAPAEFFADFGSDFGLAFQLKDDLLDAQTDGDREKNLCCLLGTEVVTTVLADLTASLGRRLEVWPQAKILQQLLAFNRQRSH